MSAPRMLFVEAMGVNPDAATDAELVAAWHSYASQISYHHADDSGKEWGSAAAIMPRARQLEAAIRSRGLPRPSGQYLMTAADRIDWDSGEWSQGWDWKKRQAAQAPA